MPKLNTVALAGGAWWRLPVTLLVGGLAIIGVTSLLHLGWIPYGLALVVIALGTGILSHGERDGTRTTQRGSIVALMVLLAGVWILHPQAWRSPGWTMSGTGDTIVGRAGSVVVMDHDDTFSGRSIDSGTVRWTHHWGGPGVLDHGRLLVQALDFPARAHAYQVSTGKSEGTARWPGTKSTADTATPVLTAAQQRALPGVGSTDKVLAQVGDGAFFARLVATRDFTGHRYTRLDVLDGDRQTSYRLGASEQLTIRNGVLLVQGSDARVINLQGA